jgi:pyruvate ferredoxin oxidoreductase gamma subunit
MTGLTEIRWHARAGQGAKTAAQLLALALMRTGKSVQAFPEYGPERRGAPLRAYTRVSDRPIRRHDSVTDPDLVVVLEPSLVHEIDVGEGLAPGGFVLVNADEEPRELAAERGSSFANVVMVGAVAGALGESLAEVQDAAVDVLGRKADADSVRAAVAEGWAWLN